MGVKPTNLGEVKPSGPGMAMPESTLAASYRIAWKPVPRGCVSQPLPLPQSGTLSNLTPSHNLKFKPPTHRTPFPGFPSARLLVSQFCQCCSNWPVDRNLLGILLKCRCLVSGPRLRLCISHKLPGDAAAGPWTTVE